MPSLPHPGQAALRVSSGLFMLGDDSSHRVAKLDGGEISHIPAVQTIAEIGAHSAMTWSRRI